MEKNWRAFNYVFIVVYPPEKENDVLNALGPLENENEAYRAAYERAKQEAASLSDVRDRFFAWYNAGTSLVYLSDYAGAAVAYDTAFSLYSQIPEDLRPWRMMWYQTGPYFAYYYSARYSDVIDLADQTLERMTANRSSRKAITGAVWPTWRSVTVKVPSLTSATASNTTRGLAPAWPRSQQMGETP